eukprot:1644871-Karenia_brevis.AAC.1
MLFSLALQPTLQKLVSTTAQQQGLDLVFSYLDDLCLAGNHHVVSQAVNTLQEEIRVLGLTLSTDNKCEVIPTAGQAHTVDVSAFPAHFRVITNQ